MPRHPVLALLIGCTFAKGSRDRCIDSVYSLGYPRYRVQTAAMRYTFIRGHMLQGNGCRSRDATLRLTNIAHFSIGDIIAMIINFRQVCILYGNEGEWLYIIVGEVCIHVRVKHHDVWHNQKAVQGTTPLPAYLLIKSCIFSPWKLTFRAIPFAQNISMRVVFASLSSPPMFVLNNYPILHNILA